MSLFYSNTIILQLTPWLNVFGAKMAPDEAKDGVICFEDKKRFDKGFNPF